MTVFTYSKARQNFSSLLDTASKDGEVLIRRRDGRLFSVRPQVRNKSPFDVAGIKTKVTTQQILEAIRESRSRL
jgi:antitoxin Phd